MVELTRARGPGQPRKTEVLNRIQALAEHGQQPEKGNVETREKEPRSELTNAHSPATTTHESSTVAGKPTLSWASILQGGSSKPMVAEQEKSAESTPKEGKQTQNNKTTTTTEGNTPSNPKTVKIDYSDIEDEVKYWESAVVCFVVGVNLPLHVIDGFVSRIWKDLEVDTIGMIDKEVFLVRLKSTGVRDKAYETNGVLFDNKPFVIKLWTPEMPTDKSSIATMPIWIKLPKLKVEYWGKTSLKKR